MRKFDKHGFGVAFRSFGILVLLFTLYIFVVHVLMPLTYAGVADGVYNKGDTFSVRYKKENPNINTFDKVELRVFILCLGVSLISFLLSGILFKRSKFV